MSGRIAKLAAVAVAAAGLAAVHGVAAPASPQTGAGGFGARVAQHVAVHPIEVQLAAGQGALQRIACAPGARPGTTCFVAAR